jgi:hypothetical protein
MSSVTRRRAVDLLTTVDNGDWLTTDVLAEQVALVDDVHLERVAVVVQTRNRRWLSGCKTGQFEKATKNGWART